MRKTLFLIPLIILFCLFNFNVSAKENEFEINVGEGYTSAYLDTDKKELCKVLGITEEELEETFKEDGILMLAVSHDKKVQIRISSYENDFSELAYDISALEDDTLKDFANKVSPESEYSIVENNNRQFVSFEKSHKDSGGEYLVSHYVTVANGKTYQLSFYNPPAVSGEYKDEILKTFSINNIKQGGIPLWQTMLFIFGIAVFAAVAVVMIVSIIKERKE